MKSAALLRLARLRQASRLDGYACIGDFHGGLFECDHVSPWTKSGGKFDAAVMVVGQDWSSADVLAAVPPSRDVAVLGFDAKFPTNANLDALLARHLGLRRADCYLTNLFPFVKPGGPSAAIPMRHLIACAERFTLPEIGIVAPRLVVCLGLRTFTALRRAAKLEGAPGMDAAVGSPFRAGSAAIHCVAHTGARGMNNRGRAQVEADWRAMAAAFGEPAALAG